MSESTPPRSPEPEDAPTPAASVAADQPTAPQPLAQPVRDWPEQAPFPQSATQPNAVGPFPQSAYSYPPAPPSAASGWRSSGTRVALLIVGSIVVGLMLFGGGYLTASAVNSIPGISDGRNDGPRMGPGGEWPGGELDERGPGTRDDSDTGTDGSTDTSVVPG